MHVYIHIYIYIHPAVSVHASESATSFGILSKTFKSSQIRWSFLTVLITFYSGLSDHFNIKAGPVKSRGVTRESKCLNIWDESKRNLTLTLSDRIRIKLSSTFSPQSCSFSPHSQTNVQILFGSNVIFMPGSIYSLSTLSLHQMKNYLTWLLLHFKHLRKTEAD